MIGFGEIALLLNDKRTATVTAACPEGCDTWVLSVDVFKNIIASNTLRRRNINLQTLDQVSIFKTLDQYEKLKLIDGLKTETFSQNDFLFQEGDEGEGFYIIEEGEVECLKSLSDGQYSLVRTLGQGDHFGEIALIQDVKRTLSIRAKSAQTKLFVLSREAFKRIVGTIRVNLNEDYKKEEVSKSKSVGNETQDDDRQK